MPTLQKGVGRLLKYRPGLIAEPPGTLTQGARLGVAEPQPWRKAMKAMGRGADAVLVTVGAIPAYNDAPRYLGRGGRIVMISGSRPTMIVSVWWRAWLHLQSVGFRKSIKHAM